VTLHGLVAPGDVSPLLSVQLFVAVLLGGGAVVLGPVLGVAVLAAIPSVADRFASAVGMPVERARGVLTAALLILALAVRDPVAGLVSRLLPARSRRRPGLPPARAATPFRVAAAGAPLLEARALVRSFGAVRALDGLDLDVRAGEVHALIGPNGSGKTTALRVLSGAVSPDRGTVRVNGADVTRGGEADRVRAGVVRTFQRTVLLPGVAVGAQVAAGARAGEAAGRALPALLGVPSARRRHHESLGAVAALLADTRLLARADDPPTNLAHGEQRLLQIARAVATGARVLLLDEPAAGMTPDEVAVLRDELRRLVGNGAGVLLVEHDVRFVSAVADRVTVLAEGRVLAVGTPAQVRRDPAVQLAYLGRQHLREGDDT
jgi:branched-chain amino acid transport system permease protein